MIFGHPFAISNLARNFSFFWFYFSRTHLGMSVDIAMATSALGGLCHAAVTYTPYVNSEQSRRATQYVASRVDAIGRSELSESWLRDVCEKSFSFVSFFRVAKRGGCFLSSFLAARSAAC